MENQDQILVLLKGFICNQTKQTFEYIPLILASQSIESVHKSRVGYRKLRTNLKVIKPLLGNKRYRYCKLQTRWISRSIGNVRDLDIFKLGFEQFVGDNFPNVNFEQRIWLPLYSERYQKAFLTLQKNIGSAEHTIFREQLLNLLNATYPGSINEDQGTQYDPKLNKSFIADNFLQSSDQISNLHYRLHVSPNDTHYHKLRIEMKKIRYRLELIFPFLNQSLATDLIENLTEFQDLLGMINDFSTSENLINKARSNFNHLEFNNSWSFFREYSEFLSVEKIKSKKSFGEFWKIVEAKNLYDWISDCLPN